MAKSGVDSKTLIQIQKRVESVPPGALAQELQRNAQALVQQPKNAALQFGVGLLYARIGDYASAVTVLDRARKFSKNNPIVLGVLAFIHSNQLGDHPSAIKYLQKKLESEPRDVPAYLLIANSHIQIGQANKAIEFLDKAEALAQENLLVRIMAMRSQCYQRMGDFDKARDELLRLADTDANGLVSVADVLSRMPNLDAELEEKLDQTMQQALESTPQKFRDNAHQATTAVAVANLKEGKGEYEQAFHFFEKARKLHPQDTNAWSFKETGEFEIYKGVFGDNFFAKLPTGHSSDKQIFIVGMPRSGTTLLESILSSNEAVIDHGELMYFVEQQHRMGFTSEKNPNIPERIELLKKLLASAPGDGFKDIGAAYIKRYGFDRQPGKYHVDKMPHNFRTLGLIAATFPNARIIHAARHPMDICLSNYKNLLPGYNTTFSGTLEALGEYYLEYASLMRFWQEKLPIDIHTVRYEHLIADTPGQSEAIFNYCGVPWNPEDLQNRKAKSDVNTASMWQVRQDIYSSSVQKWRNYEAKLKPLLDVIKEEVNTYEAGL